MSEYNKIKRGIASTLVAAMFLSGCGKSEEKNDTPTPTPTPTETIELITESEKNAFVEQIMSLGYSAEFAEKICANKTTGQIVEIIASLNEEVKLANILNNASELQKAGFFKGYDIETIAEIIKAIDDKLLYKADYVNYVTMLDETFNQVSEDYLLDNITLEDKNIVAALPYLALPGTDLNDCFTTLSKLYLNILNHPQIKLPKESLYKFIIISLNSLNHLDNDEELLTGSEEFIEAAQIRNYIDLYMAFNNIMVPLIPLIDVQMKDYDPDTYDNSRADNIFATADSLFNAEQFQSLCNGESR